MVDVPYTIAPPLQSVAADTAIGRVSRAYFVDANGSLSTNNPASPQVTDSDAVDEQVLNVLLTPLGSDEFEPNFGSTIPLLLFEPMSIDTARRIRVDARTSIRRWLADRISSVNVMVEPNEDEGYYTVAIAYVVDFSGARQQFIVSISKR